MQVKILSNKVKWPFAIRGRDVPDIPAFRGRLLVIKIGRNKEFGRSGAEEWVHYNDPKCTQLIQDIVVSFLLVLQPHVHIVWLLYKHYFL